MLKCVSNAREKQLFSINSDSIELLTESKPVLLKQGLNDTAFKLYLNVGLRKCTLPDRKERQCCLVRTRGYETFFVLNTAEHELLNAH